MHRLPLVLALLGLLGCQDISLRGFCAVPVEDSPVRGPADAWVTIVEFSDFQCPYCGAVAPVLHQVLEAYPDDVRLVFKHRPLSSHEHARPAAVAAICAHEQGRFWELHDLLFADQDALGEDDLIAAARLAGLELESWEACRTSTRPTERLELDDDAARRAQVVGTPTFFFNGYARVGAAGFDAFAAEIDDALDDALVSEIDRAEYYETLTGYACE